MSSSDGKANGKRSRSLEVSSAVIADAVDDEHQNEGDSGLDHESLHGIQRRVEVRVAQIALEDGVRRRKL